jgi:hypothetical protein
LELRGEVRGGRFVSGFTGEQFALPEAVESLRALRRSPSGERVPHEIKICGADPLNLIGVILPGPRVPAIPSTYLVFRDGIPVEIGRGRGADYFSTDLLDPKKVGRMLEHYKRIGQEPSHWSVLTPERGRNCLNLEEVPEYALKEAQRRYEVVKRAIEISEGPRGNKTLEIRKLAEQHGLTFDTVYRWLSGFREKGFPALLPLWGKARGTFRAIPQQIQVFMKEEYIRSSNLSPAQMHHRVKEYCFKTKLRCPSVATVARYLRGLPPPEVISQLRIASQNMPGLDETSAQTGTHSET